ncbi:hypothetical protein [Smaragdicoccus niigatensis]|uniref:hypothetical protein n=1 Tax=Smaragdicoccus niigatensis TaxID=359359 RepID=UPI00037D4BB2|nr:hypothetical protein [Smaragdicoccus niigatensis]
MNITKSAVLLVAGMASLTVACSNAGTSMSGNATSSSKTTASSATTASPSAPATNVETVDNTMSSPVETGTIVVHVSDLEGSRLGNIEVKAFLVPACDPSDHELPAVDGYLKSLQDRTDGNGNVVFTSVPLGCWSVAATVPAGFSRVESTRAAAYLVNGGDAEEADLHLQRGLSDPCNGDALSNAMGASTITIAHCDGSWALVSEACGPNDSCENGPGDNTRILRVQGDRWVTYTALPSTTCLSTAKHDGVPGDLQKYFNANC